MQRGILLDTGPLVAYFCAADRFHAWAVERFSSFPAPVITCEPVLAEACFLLARAGVRPERVLDKVAGGALSIGINLAAEAASLSAMMKRYADVPMSLADACLVRMAEMLGGPVCTLDGDFLIYRRYGRGRLDLVIPPGIDR